MRIITDKDYILLQEKKKKSKELKSVKKTGKAKEM